MLLIGFVVCLWVFLRRRKQGTTVAIPLAVMGLFAVRLVLFFVTVVLLIGTFKTLAEVPAEHKQVRLSQGIDEAMRPVRFGMVWELPILLVAWASDVVLRRRQRKPFLLAVAPPEGALCPRHPETAATSVCGRCGTFACPSCSADGGTVCSACAALAPQR